MIHIGQWTFELSSPNRSLIMKSLSCHHHHKSPSPLLFALGLSLSVALLIYLNHASAAAGDPDPAFNPPSAAGGNYPNTSVALSGDTTVTPDAPIGASSINVSTDTNFKGTFAANPLKGVVRVTDAHPAGTYTVTVKPNNGVNRTFLLTVQQGSACTGFSFLHAPDVNGSSGGSPYFVAVGDFNNDGKQDLAAANFDSNTVSIRLGNGASGFSGTTEVVVGS